MNKILRAVFLFGVITGTMTTVVFAQTPTTGFTYTFPRIQSPGLQMVISNLNTVDAVARVTFYKDTGITVLSTRVVVPAGTLTIVDDAATSLGGFLGAAVVESATA